MNQLRPGKLSFDTKVVVHCVDDQSIDFHGNDAELLGHFFPDISIFLGSRSIQKATNPRGSTKSMIVRSSITPG
jgi:hypothetical protein